MFASHRPPRPGPGTAPRLPRRLLGNGLSGGGRGQWSGRGASPHHHDIQGRLDVSVVSPPVRPTSEAVARAADGSGRTVSSYDVVVAPGLGPPITGTSVSGCTTFTPVIADASSTICSPLVRSIMDATIVRLVVLFPPSPTKTSRSRLAAPRPPCAPPTYSSPFVLPWVPSPLPVAPA